MNEKSNTIKIEAVSTGTKRSRLGLTSLIAAVAATPFFFISIHRIHSINEKHPDVCVVRDTAFYNTIHTLCAVLPIAAVILSVLSLMRCRRNKISFIEAIPAIGGMLIAVVSFTIYLLDLLALAYGNFH